MSRAESRESKVLRLDEFPGTRPSSLVPRQAFTLIEVLVVVTLLAFIIIALMGVFGATQTAFRASITQTDVLESGRAAMDLITGDLRGMAPSYGTNFNFSPGNSAAVNFFSYSNYYAYTPLEQNLPASNTKRMNLLNYFFILGRENNTWTGTGYIVNTADNSPIYSLYRYHAETNITASPRALYDDFLIKINNAQWTSMSHMMDGVVHLVVRAYDVDGIWLTNGYTRGMVPPANVLFSRPFGGEVGFHFYSNALPAAVEIEIGTLEDRTLQRAESLGVPGQWPSPAPATAAQWSYLQNQAATRVHIFRQRVNIPNVVPAAYQ